MTSDSRHSQPCFALSGLRRQESQTGSRGRRPCTRGARGQSVSRRFRLLRAAGPSSVCKASSHVSVCNAPASSSHVADMCGSVGLRRRSGETPRSAPSQLHGPFRHVGDTAAGSEGSGADVFGPSLCPPQGPSPAGWNPDPQCTKKEGRPPATFSGLGGHTGRPAGRLGQQMLRPAWQRGVWRIQPVP